MRHSVALMASAKTLRLRQSLTSAVDDTLCDEGAQVSLPRCSNLLLFLVCLQVDHAIITPAMLTTMARTPMMMLTLLSVERLRGETRGVYVAERMK